MSRVEILEHGMEVLLEAQVWHISSSPHLLSPLLFLGTSMAIKARKEIFDVLHHVASP